MDLHRGSHRWATDRRVRARLLASGLRWRARSSVAMLAVAVFATGTAAFGPIYLHGADQRVLDRTIAAAPPQVSGLTLAPLTRSRSASSLLAISETAPGALRGPGRWWGRPITTVRATFLTVPTTPTAKDVRATSGLPYGVTRPFQGQLVSRTGGCAHLVFVAGTCPRAVGVAVSTRTARLLGLGIGGHLAVTFAHRRAPVALRVSGIYDPLRSVSRAWWGEDVFRFGTFAPRLTALVELDTVFATRAQVRAAAPAADVRDAVELPFRHDSLAVGQVASFERRLRAYTSAVFTHDAVRVTTGVSGSLAHAGAVERTAGTVVGVADLELVLLGIFVLFFVAGRTAGEREPDVRLGELRGFAARSSVSVALGEPLVIVVAAVPLGLAAAWAAAGAVGPEVFGPGIGVSLGWTALGAPLAAGAAGLVAAALGARRALAAGLVHSPLPGATARTGRSRWASAVDVGAVALATAAFVELVVTGDAGSAAGTDPLAALAPGLLAVAVGVVVARLVPRILSATHPRSAFGPHAARALAARTVARRREFGAQVVLTALAVALSTFAVCGWAIAGRNRDLRAALGVGAPTVLSVSVRPGTTFLAAVRGADPTGREAMAVVVEHARDGTTLAVDAGRLASVAVWPGDLGMHAASVAARLLATHVAPPVDITGRAVEATVRTTADAQPAPHLRLDLYDPGAQYASSVTLGALEDGTHLYRATLGRACSGGCRVRDLSVTWGPGPLARGPLPAGGVSPSAAPGAPPTVSFVIRSLEDLRAGRWRPVAAGLGDPRRWSTPSRAVRLLHTSGGLGARMTLNDFGVPLLVAPADVPPALPVVVTPMSDSTASGDAGPLLVGLDGSTLDGHRVADVPTLPGVGPDALLTNLSTAERALTGPMRTETPEVWLAHPPSRRLLARLRARGVAVLSRSTVAGAVARQAKSGLALAYLLYLVIAVAGGLLLVGATAFTLSSGARRRQVELASLRAVGLGAGALRRALGVEQLLVLGTGALAGLLAGGVAAVVALRSVPEFAAGSPGPPLELGLPPAALALTVAALAAGLALVVALASSAIVAGATVDRLAGGPS